MKYQKKHKVMLHITFLLIMVTWIKTVEGTNKNQGTMDEENGLGIEMLSHPKNAPQQSESGIMLLVASLTFGFNILTTQLNYAAFIIPGLGGEGETGIYRYHLLSERGFLAPWPFHFISDTLAGLWPLSTLLQFCAVWNFYFGFFLMFYPTDYGLFRNIKRYWRFWKASHADQQKFFTSFTMLGMLILSVFFDAPISTTAHHLGVAINSTAAVIIHQIHQIASIICFVSMFMVTRIQVKYVNPRLLIKKWVAILGQQIAYYLMQLPAGLIFFIRLLIGGLHIGGVVMASWVYRLAEYSLTPLAEWILGMGLFTFMLGLAVQSIENVGPSLKNIFNNHKGKAMVTLIVNFIWLFLVIFIFVKGN